MTKKLCSDVKKKIYVEFLLTFILVFSYVFCVDKYFKYLSETSNILDLLTNFKSSILPYFYPHYIKTIILFPFNYFLVPSYFFSFFSKIYDMLPLSPPLFQHTLTLSPLRRTSRPSSCLPHPPLYLHSFVVVPPTVCCFAAPLIICCWVFNRLSHLHSFA